MENTTGYTPGPWKLHKYPGQVEAENGMACCGHESIIASTFGHSCNAELLRSEQDANAQLIASAPEMHAALVDLIEQIEAYDRLQGANSCAVSPDAALAAVDKAEGKH